MCRDALPIIYIIDGLCIATHYLYYYYSLIIYTQQQLLLECGYLEGGVEENENTEDTIGSDKEEEEEPIITSTPVIDIAKRLLNGKEELPVEVAKAIYNTSKGEEYKGTTFIIFFYL